MTLTLLLSIETEALHLVPPCGAKTDVRGRKLHLPPRTPGTDEGGGASLGARPGLESRLRGSIPRRSTAVAVLHDNDPPLEGGNMRLCRRHTLTLPPSLLYVRSTTSAGVAGRGWPKCRTYGTSLQ